MEQLLVVRHLLSLAIAMSSLLACSASSTPLISGAYKEETERSVSRARFSDRELAFLTEELGRLVKGDDLSLRVDDDDTGAGKKVHVTKQRGLIYIKGNGQHPPSREMIPEYRTEFRRDFDRNGTTETFFTVLFSAGGNAAWNELYSLENTKSGAMKLHSLYVDCPCPSPLECPASTSPELETVEKGLIAVRFGCCKVFGCYHANADEARALYRYREGKLQRKSVRVIEQKRTD